LNIFFPISSEGALFGS